MTAETLPAETSPAEVSDRPTSRRRSFGRRLLRAVLLIAVPAAALTGGAWLYASTGRYVTTDNAYVKSDKITVSSDISGRVVEVLVGDNQPIAAGQVLFRTDRRPFEITVAEAEAEMRRVRTRLKALRSDYREAQSAMAEASTRLALLDHQYERYSKLVEKGVVTSAKYEEIEFDRQAAGQRVTALRERINGVLIELGGSMDMPVEKHPLYLKAQARKDRALLDLAYTEVLSPGDGIVSNMNLQVGEYVEAGRPVFLIVAAQTPWLEANLKETQLGHVEIGQTATFELDAYPGLEWRATIESIAPATGAEFALLPPQNSSGNWVKVVQRVPVKLRILPNATGRELRTGMTATVRIDTLQRSLLSLVDTALAFVGAERPTLGRQE